MLQRSLWPRFGIFILLWLGSVFPSLGQQLQAVTGGSPFNSDHDFNITVTSADSGIKYKIVKDGTFVTDFYGSVAYTDLLTFNVYTGTVDWDDGEDRDLPSSAFTYEIFERYGSVVLASITVPARVLNILKDSPSDYGITGNPYSWNINLDTGESVLSGVPTLPEPEEENLFRAVGLDLDASDGPLLVKKINPVTDAVEWVVENDLGDRVDTVPHLSAGTNDLNEGDWVEFSSLTLDAIRGVIKGDASGGKVWMPEGVEYLGSKEYDAYEYELPQGTYTKNPTTGKFEDSEGKAPKKNLNLVVKKTTANGVVTVTTIIVNNNTNSTTTTNNTSKATDKTDLTGAEGAALGVGVVFVGEEGGQAESAKAALEGLYELEMPDFEGSYEDQTNSLQDLMDKLEFYAQGQTIPRASAFNANIPFVNGRVIPLHIPLTGSGIIIIRGLLNFVLILFMWRRIFLIMNI